MGQQFDNTDQELRRDRRTKILPEGQAHPEGEDVYDEESDTPKDDFTADAGVRFTPSKTDQSYS